MFGARRFAIFPDYVHFPTLHRRQPLSLAFAGYLGFNSGLVYGVDGYGDFWPSTSDSIPNARVLGFYSNGWGPQGTNYKGYGFSVRGVISDDNGLATT